VSRDKSDKDKRITVINLTEEGINLRKKHENSHKKLVRTALDKLSTSEKVALMNAINKIEM
jgi:DNA-binding MarR family transcriptional regulator